MAKHILGPVSAFPPGSRKILEIAGRSIGVFSVEGGTLGVHGRLPTTTDGGHLSNASMQGWALNIEAVRQLRGECGARQVPDCEVVHYVAATPCTRSIIYTKG